MSKNIRLYVLQKSHITVALLYINMSRYTRLKV